MKKRILSLKLVACLVAYGLEPQVQKVVERSATLLNDALKSGSKNSIGDSKEIDEIGLYVTNDPQLSEENFQYLIDDQH